MHTITVDMFANVAVLGSELRGSKDSRRIVVPAGRRDPRGGRCCTRGINCCSGSTRRNDARQRFQWLDPSSGDVDTGEMYSRAETTIDVLGKKTKVTVYKAERQRLGPATLYVDAKKRIVKAEQNMLTYRLDEWSEELAKK